MKHNDIVPEAFSTNERGHKEYSSRIECTATKESINTNKLPHRAIFAMPCLQIFDYLMTCFKHLLTVGVAKQCHADEGNNKNYKTRLIDL